MSIKRDWEGYYKLQQGRAPREIFLDALTFFDEGESRQRFAVDLGCGDGTETVHLLQAGWRVLAIDQEPAAIEYVHALVRPELRAFLETRVSAFENLMLPPSDFIHAGFSLPFCQPAYFNTLWTMLTTALHPGGRFAGQLFGVHDTWVTNTDMNFHTREQVEALLGAYEVEFFKEEEEDGNAFSGPKHWHVFHIIARRK